MALGPVELRKRLAVVVACCAVVGAAVAGSLALSARRPAAVFIGDSYTQGHGASGPTKDFAWQFSAAEGWNFTDLGRGSTGYLTANRSGMEACGLTYCPNYDQMIPAAAAAHPSVVIVSGGRNDVGQPATAEHAAVDKFFADLRAALPHVRLIVTSPIWDASAPPARLAQIDVWVRTAARNNHVQYLPIGEPLAKHREWTIDDRVHPNDRGYSAIARAIQQALLSRG